MESYPVSTIKTNSPTPSYDYPIPSYDYPLYCPALRGSLDATNSILSSSAGALAHLVDKTAEYLVGKTIKEWIYMAPIFSASVTERLYNQRFEIAAGLGSFLATASFATNWFRQAPSQMRQNPLGTIAQITSGVFRTSLAAGSLLYGSLKFGLIAFLNSYKVQFITLPYLGYKAISFHPAIWGGIGAYTALNILDANTCEGYREELQIAKIKSMYNSYLESLTRDLTG